MANSGGPDQTVLLEQSNTGIHCLLRLSLIILRRFTVILNGTAVWHLIQNYGRAGTRPRGYKTFFILNSSEYEIFPAHNSC